MLIMNDTKELTTINLSQWLDRPENIGDSGFQILNDFLSNQPERQVYRFAVAPRFRGMEEVLVSVTGVKEIQLAGHDLALIISCQQQTEPSKEILLRLHSASDENYLPPEVKLMVLDEAENIFLEAQARSKDNWIQLKFRGDTGDNFTIKIALGDEVFTQTSVV